MRAQLAPLLAAAAIAGALTATPSLMQPAVDPAARERAYRLNNIGVAQLEQHNHDAAAQSFAAALALVPRLPLAQLNLAIAHFYAGRPDEARRAAEAAVAALPDSPHAHYVLGLIGRFEDRTEAAVEAFTRVLRMDPSDVGARVNLGQLALQAREYADARRWFEEALAREASNVTAAYGVAMALTRSGAAEEGREAMRRFETLRTAPYGVTYTQTYLEQGRYAEALPSTGAEPDLVDPRTPDLRLVDATADMLPAGVRAAATEGGSAVALADVDGDGDLDAIVAHAGGARLLRHARGRFSDDAAAPLPAPRTPSGATGIVAADYDNDGLPDLLVLRDASLQLLHQLDNGTFADDTAAARLPLDRGARTAAFVDVDHDGDLDLFVGAASGARNLLLRNDGTGVFTDVTAAAGVSGLDAPATALVPTDYDNRRDIDLVIAYAGAAPVLFQNLRDGTFRDVAADLGLAAAGRCASPVVTAADVNKDGYSDLYFSCGAGTLAMSDGRGAFRLLAGPPTADVERAQFADLDRDGLFDLLTLRPDRLVVHRHLGDGWAPLPAAATQATAGADRRTDPYRSMAWGDLDGDGDLDALTIAASGAVQAWRNDDGRRHQSLAVRLQARVSNRSAAGARVEVRAGSLRQMREVAAVSPAIAPADLVFGLGTRTTADVVRVLWPAGILQAETDLGGAGATTRAPVTVLELDRKPSSCPYLYTWNGSRYEFVTDFLGGGEMGYWQAPGRWNAPDPDEYVRIDGRQLVPRDGRYELRITNELEEVLFLDRAQLVLIDHPASAAVFPQEGLKSTPPPFALAGRAHGRPPARATDHRGQDVTARVAHLDDRAVDGFERLDIRGYAAAHTLTLELGVDAARAVLYLTGWTDYAFSSDNVAAHQRGVAMQPPVLQIRDAGGAWRNVVDEVGIPVGRPQTLVVDLRQRVPAGVREVRLLTNMQILWDQILVDTPTSDVPMRLHRIEPLAADLRWRGFSTAIPSTDRQPLRFDYHRLTVTAPWKHMLGAYTREGDVRPLLARTDDMFVIARAGDEIALSFDAAAVPPPPAGWTRTFLLYADGFSKEMNLRSASPDTVEPLPFHAMTRYPYGADEQYPRTGAHDAYRDTYNTRRVTRVLPSLDLFLTPQVHP